MKGRCNIGVFDSGLGGVSVLKKIVEVMPHEDIIYFGDTKNIPYGAKTKDEIQKLSARIVDFLIKNNCKIIVIACNTATIASLEMLQEHCNIPIVGIINAGVDVVVANGYDEVAVLGTRFTIESKKHLMEIKAKNNDIKVTTVPCDELCPMIEKGWESYSNRENVLESYLKNVPETTEALLLACTHYPFIEEDIRKKFSGTIIDPSEECAKKIFDTLNKKSLLNPKKEKGKVEFYVTGDKKSFKDKVEKFLGYGIHRVYGVDI